MSINPGRTVPYGDDLCWRMIWQREALGLKLVTVAKNLGVYPSTVSRVVRIFQPYPKDARPNKKLTSTVQLVILHTLLQHPEMYLHELQMEVCTLTGTQSLCLLYVLSWERLTLLFKKCNWLQGNVSPKTIHYWRILVSARDVHFYWRIRVWS